MVLEGRSWALCKAFDGRLGYLGALLLHYLDLPGWHLLRRCVVWVCHGAGLLW